MDEKATEPEQHPEDKGAEEWDLEEREYNFFLTFISARSEEIQNWVSILTNVGLGLMLVPLAADSRYTNYLYIAGGLVFLFALFYNWYENRELNKFSEEIHAKYIYKYYPEDLRPVK